MDILIIVLSIGLFALAVLYVRACDSLKGDRS